MSNIKEEWKDFQVKLEKKRKFMETFYYVFLVINIIYPTMLNTPMVGNVIALIGGHMPWLPVQKGVIIFSGITNLRLLIAVPAFYTIMTDMKRTRERVCACIMMIVGWVSALFLREWNDTYLLTAALMAVASYGKDYKKIARLGIVSISGVVILSAVLCFAGILPEDEYNLFRDGKVRHSLGFFGPTGLAGHIYAVLITLIFIRNGFLKWFDYLLIVVLSVLNIVFVDGRVALVAIMLATAGCLFYTAYVKSKLQISDSIIRGYRFLMCFSYLIIGTVFSLAVITYREGLPIYNKIKFFASFEGRVEVPHRMMQELPFSVFGNYMQKYSQAENSLVQVGQYNFLDSEYARLYFIYGLVGIVFCFGLFTAIQWRLRKEKMGFSMFVVSVVALFFLVQKGIFDLSYNLFPMLLWAKLDAINNRVDGTKGSAIASEERQRADNKA